MYLHSTHLKTMVNHFHGLQQDIGIHVINFNGQFHRHIDCNLPFTNAVCGKTSGRQTYINILFVSFQINIQILLRTRLVVTSN